MGNCQQCAGLIPHGAPASTAIPGSALYTHARTRNPSYPSASNSSTQGERVAMMVSQFDLLPPWPFLQGKEALPWCLREAGYMRLQARFRHLSSRGGGGVNWKSGTWKIVVPTFLA